MAAQTLNVLVVDDDESLIADAGLIGHPGVHVTCVRDLAAARGILERQHFDAMAVNVGLPGMFDALSHLAANGKGMIVQALASTGLAGMTLEHTLTIAELRTGAMGLPKPIDAAELLASIIGQLARAAPKPAPTLTALRSHFEQMLDAG